MANAVPSRLGQQDAAGDARALFLKVFAGEVLTAFRETNVFLSRHMVRTISHGKSAQFPATWKAGAAYHVPGTELVGTPIKHNERVIVIDELLVADTFIALIDEAMNHYDVRSEYSFQLGSALSRAFDRNVAQVGVLAAREAATIDDGFGGTRILDVDLSSDAGDVLAAAAFEAAEALDEKDVPDTDRYLFVRPAEYYALVQSDAVHQDITERQNGGIDTGNVYRVAGFEIVKTNNLPNTDVDSGPAAYQGDFTDTVALAMHRSAAGTVKLLDLAVEMEYDIRRQGTLMVAKYAIGHGILRPESAVEISAEAS